MTFYVITWNPSDYQGKHVVREHCVMASGHHWIAEKPIAVVGDDLSEARRVVFGLRPRGGNLLCIGREYNDDPVIVESWLVLP